MNAEQELVDYLAIVPRRRSDSMRWPNGFIVREPADLGRSPEGHTLRALLRLSRRVRGRVPFDISLLSARPGQSVDDWFASGVAAFEAWLGLDEHDGDETSDASVEGEGHGVEPRVQA